MSGPVQNIPEGLLGFFQLKNEGRNPRDLIETIQPGLDMLEWYFVSTAVVERGVQASVNAEGEVYTGIQVPRNEIWYLHSIVASCNINAAETIQLIMGYRPPEGRFLQPFSNQPVFTTTASNANLEFGCQPRMFCNSGTLFGACIAEITTAANIEIDFDLYVTKLRR